MYIDIMKVWELTQKSLKKVHLKLLVEIQFGTSFIKICQRENIEVRKPIGALKIGGEKQRGQK